MSVRRRDKKQLLFEFIIKQQDIQLLPLVILLLVLKVLRIEGIDKRGITIERRKLIQDANSDI